MRRVLSGLLALAMLLAAAGQALAEDFSAAFPDRFLAEGEAPAVTETTYQSHNIAIEITARRYGNADVYVADVYIRSTECFQRVYSGGAWDKKREPLGTLAASSGAILAMTGDSSDQGAGAGWIVGDGVVWRSTKNTKRDLAVLYRDGTMAAFRKPGSDVHERLLEEQDSIWQTFLFGPTLLDENGKAYEKFDSNVKASNPRSVIGYYEPGHYCFVQVDGRSTKSVLEEHAVNLGLTLAELAQLMESLGCKAAYNLDGGRSSMLWFMDGVISSPQAPNRAIGDIVVISEVE